MPYINFFKPAKIGKLFQTHLSPPKLYDVLRLIQPLQNAADATEADASEATDNTETCTAAANAADATKVATFNQSPGRLADDTYEKKPQAEAFNC